MLGDDIVQLSYVYSDSSPKFWRVLKEIPVLLTTGREIVIPVGFATDLSSSPRWLWSVARPYGDFVLASIIHDYLYVYNIGTRAQADQEMLIWSNVLNANRFDNYCRYLAVRLFGKSWWNAAGARFKRLVK